MVMREIEYTVSQRREGVTLGSGATSRYYYLVTTVISEVREKGTTIPIHATDPGDSPLLNLFLIESRGAVASSKFVEDSLVPGRVATVEDFSDNGSLVGAGAEPWLKTPRLFFPTSANTDPAVGTPIAPKDLELGDVTIVCPTAAVPCPVLVDTPFFVSNMRIDVFLTVTDADAAAAAYRNIINVFQTRYNEIASSFGTSDPANINGYKKYSL